MIAAAGILFVTDDGKALYLQRSGTGDRAGEWCWPGGKIEGGETAEEAACREAREEIGFVPKGERREWTRQVANSEVAGAAERDTVEMPGDPVDFTTFLQRVEKPFTPRLDQEHTAYAWAPLTQPPEPLHPGARIALARFSMDELGIARAMAAGELTSPQRYENVWLFDIRITGTGASYRSAHDEYVWRDPSIYLNPEFLARCNGLPVIWEHPEKSQLTSDEFSARIIGTVFLPFLKGEDVRGIAKIYDDAAVTALRTKQWSTSPGVDVGGLKGKLDDDSRLLIENDPTLVDHIAICANGVWDKGGPPVGVSSVTAEEPVMAEKDLAEERKDAANDLMTKLDAALSKLDSAHARLDAMEADRRKDAEEREREEREERDRKDAARRKDEGEKEEEERQARELERLAAEEREEGEKDARKDKLRRRDGEDCMDHSKRVDAFAKKHRHDRMGRRDSESEEEHSRRVDAHYPRRDAETEEEREALKKANEAREREEKDRKDAERRADAAERENADLKARLAGIETRVHEMSRETTAAERDDLARVQARADSVAALFGNRVSGPTPGETVLGYQRRVLRDFLPYSAQFKGANIDAADAATLGLIENQVYADAQAASRAEAGQKPGVLIPRVSTDGAGRTITRFDGDMSAWLGYFQTDGARVKISRPAAN